MCCSVEQLDCRRNNSRISATHLVPTTSKAAMREARNLGKARFVTAKALIDDLEEGAKQ